MFSFGTPKTDAAPTFSFGSPAAGDAKADATKPAFGTPATTTSQQPNLFGSVGKPASTFTLGATSTSAPTLQFNLGGTSIAATTTTATTGFSLGGAASTTTTAAPAGGFTFGTTTAAPVASSSAPTLQFNLGGTGTTATTTTASTGFSLGNVSTASTTITAASSAAPAASTGFSLGAAKTTGGLTFGTPTISATSSASGFSLGTPATTASTAFTSSSSTTAALPTTGSLTFAQLEDAINKWTIDLEDQGKLFSNQAKQMNAWDQYLISNSEKVLCLSNGIENLKQQQATLDQELDFVQAQQKELEDLIAPLEKELAEIPVTDLDRNHTYQMAENMDTQLKQMSEDLKEIIEQLNEANKSQELSNPITQIGKILNAHMNSLQWIDRNTNKISTHLDQISKMSDMNRRNNEKTFRSFD